MRRMSVLDVADVSGGYNDLLFLFIKEDLPMQRDSLFNAKVPLIESTLMFRAALHFVEDRFKSLNSIRFAVLSLSLFNWINVLQSLLCEVLHALESLLYHVRGIELNKTVFQVASKALEWFCNY